MTLRYKDAMGMHHKVDDDAEREKRRLTATIAADSAMGTQGSADNASADRKQATCWQ